MEVIGSKRQRLPDWLYLGPDDPQTGPLPLLEGGPPRRQATEFTQSVSGESRSGEGSNYFAAVAERAGLGPDRPEASMFGGFIRGLDSMRSLPLIAVEEGLDRAFGEGEIAYGSEIMHAGNARLARTMSQMFGFWNRAAMASAEWTGLAGTRLLTEMSEGLRDAKDLASGNFDALADPDRERERELAFLLNDVQWRSDVEFARTHGGNPLNMAQQYFGRLGQYFGSNYIEPTGRLNAEPELIDYADPRRALQLFLREAPNTGAMMLASLVGAPPAATATTRLGAVGAALNPFRSSPAFLALVGGSTAEDYLQEVERYEAETGESVPVWQKMMGAGIVTGTTLVSERIGLQAMGSVGRVAMDSIKRNVMLRLLAAPVGEGATESFQGYVNNVMHLTYQDSPFRAYFSDQMRNEALRDFYGGAIIGGAVGGGMYGLARGVKPRPQAELVSIAPNEEGILEPKFRVNYGPAAGQTLTANAAIDAGVVLPAFRRDLLIEQVMSTDNNMTREKAEVSMRLMLDSIARRAGLTTEEYIDQAHIVGRNDPTQVVGAALYQDPRTGRNPMWTSRLTSTLETVSSKGGIPKEASGRDMMDVVNRLQSSGRFTAEEVEYTGLKDWLEMRGDTPVTQAEVLNFVRNNGVQLTEVWTTQRAITQTTENFERLLGQIQDHVDSNGLIEDAHSIRADIREGLEAGDMSWIGEALRAPGIDPILRSQLLSEVISMRMDMSGPALQYGGYHVGEGTNKRELLLMLPELEERNLDRLQETEMELGRTVGNYSSLDAGRYISGHWSDRQYKNLLLHARVDDRVLEDGRKVLFINELQSDPHNEARDVRDNRAMDQFNKEWADLTPAERDQLGAESGYKERPRVRAERNTRRKALMTQRQDLLDEAVNVLSSYVPAEAQEASTTPNVFGTAIRDYLKNPGAGARNGFRALKDLLAIINPDKEQEIAPLLEDYQTRHDELTDQLFELIDPPQEGVLNLPFKEEWYDLALRRLIMEAVDAGYDGIMLVDGESISRTVNATTSRHVMANRMFYDTKGVRRLEKLSGEKGERMPIPQLIFPMEEQLSPYVQYSTSPEPDGGVSVYRQLYNTDGSYIGPREYQDTYATQELADKAAKDRERREGRPDRRNPNLNTAFFVPITDKVKQKFIGPQPLFQGQKGAFQLLQTGQRIISLFEKGDVTTLVHELAHVADSFLPQAVIDGIYTALGVDTTQPLTVPDRELFARALEQVFYKGELDVPGYESETRALRDWFREVYTTFAGSEIDIQLPDNIRESFEDLFGERFDADLAATQKKAGLWTRLLDAGSVTRAWERAGMPKTGERTRLYFSEMETREDYGASLYRRLLQISGGKKQLLEVLLMYNRGDDGSQSGAPKEYREAIRLYKEYVDTSLREYRRLGGLKQGYVEKLHQDLNTRLTQLLAGAVLPPNIAHALATGTVTSQQLSKFIPSKDATVAEAIINLQKIITNAPVNYLHIPYFWLEQQINTNPNNAKRVLRILAQRETGEFSLDQLIADGTLDRDEIDPADIFASFAHRLGKDMALLKLREAAILEGAARRRPDREKGDDDTTDEQLSSGWVEPYEPAFAGYEVTPQLQAWIKSVTSPAPFQTVRNIIKTFKLWAFYNPTIMTSFNMIQLGLGSIHDPINAIPAFARGYQSWRKRDHKFWELMYAGLYSTPFPLPWSDVKRKFTNIEDPLWRRALLGATVGATAGLAVGGPAGAATGAKMGTILAAAKPEQWLSYGLEAWRRAEQNEDSLMITRTLFETSHKAISNIYEASWDITWSLDQMMRSMLAEYYLEQGMTIPEAAKTAAEIFGDYAAVPRQTRENLNFIFFTPTYKIAMARMYKHSLESAIRQMSDRGNIVDRNMASVLTNTFGIMFAADFLATAVLGWDREEFGKRYSTRIREENPEALDRGFDRDVVNVFSGPHEVLTKHFLRTYRAFTEPSDMTAFGAWMKANRWELTPALNIILNTFLMNEDQRGNPFRWRLEDDWRGMERWTYYALTNSLQVLKPFVGEEFDAKASALFEQQYGSFWEVASGAVLYRYSRTPREIALAKEYIFIAAQIRSVEERLKRLVTSGATREEFDRAASDPYIQEVIRNGIAQINEIQHEMDSYYWNRQQGLGEDATIIPLAPSTGLFQPGELESLVPGYSAPQPAESGLNGQETGVMDGEVTEIPPPGF